MKISGRQFFKYFYISILIFWVILSLHIFYLFLESVSETKPVKGGTMVESVFDKINYLPYYSNNITDKFYQNFLFNRCLDTLLSGNQIGYKEDLCNIKTSDYKTFEIGLLPDKYWSDGKLITIHDLDFTFKDIIKNNIWKLSYLDNYNNLKTYLSGDNLVITFPNASIDNQILFTNFILPQHILANKTFIEYLNLYNTNPIFSNCGNIDYSNKDKNSIIFDLSKCNNYFIKYYQIKKFESFNEFRIYQSNSHDSFVDLYIYPENLSGFKQNKIVLNQFLNIFFNTKSKYLTVQARSVLANLIISNIYTGNYDQYFIKDNFLFDNYGSNNSGSDLQKIISNINFSNENSSIIQTGVISNITGNTSLITSGINNYTRLSDPNKIIISTGDSTGEKIFYLAEVINKPFPLDFVVNQDFDALSIIQGTGKNDYFLKSFHKGEKNARYNISPIYKNIHKGKNTYTLKGYQKNKQISSMQIIIYYLEKPIIPIIDIKVKVPIFTGTVVHINKTAINTGSDNKFKIIYLANPTTNYIAQELAKIFQQYKINNYFTFVAINNIDEYKGKIESNDYDIVISIMNMGLSKEYLSNIFYTEDPILNPARYKNNNLGSLINQYFLSNNKLLSKIKSEIDSIYINDIPFIIIGKIYGTINVRRELDLNFPFKLYDYTLRKEYLPNIKLISKPDWNFKKFFSLTNFFNFLNKEFNNTNDN